LLSGIRLEVMIRVLLRARARVPAAAADEQTLSVSGDESPALPGVSDSCGDRPEGLLASGRLAGVGGVVVGSPAGAAGSAAGAAGDG
jgi:hypothetical protein